jgi:hypothetical protein
MQSDSYQSKSLTQTQPNTKMEVGTLHSKEGYSATEGRQGLTVEEIVNSIERSIKNEVRPENISHLIELLREKLRELGVL